MFPMVALQPGFTLRGLHHLQRRRLSGEPCHRWNDLRDLGQSELQDPCLGVLWGSPGLLQRGEASKKERLGWKNFLTWNGKRWDQWWFNYDSMMIYDDQLWSTMIKSDSMMVQWWFDDHVWRQPQSPAFHEPRFGPPATSPVEVVESFIGRPGDCLTDGDGSKPGSPYEHQNSW